MFWLIKENQNNLDNCQFYQIFENDQIEINQNIIYNFNKEINLNNIKKEIFNYEIKILGNYIYFKNLKSNDIKIFNQKCNFEKPENNIINKSIFHNIYKKINSSQFPELKIGNYDFYYSNNEFHIFNISDNIILIKEYINDEFKKNFWLTNNLEYYSNFIAKV